MPFSADYSDYVRFKRIQKTIDGNRNLDSRKLRAPLAYGGYNPSYSIGYLPPNLFTSGRLIPQPAPPGPPGPPAGFYDFAHIYTGVGKLQITFTLIDTNSPTQIDFGDGCPPETITSGVTVEHTYPTVGSSYDITLSNPTNIEVIECISIFLRRITLASYTSLADLAINNSTGITGLTNIPPSLEALNISNTGITSLTIPTSSSLTTIDASNAASLSTITGIGNATNFNYLSIDGTAITDCDELKALFDALPMSSNAEVKYTPGGCATVTLEAAARANGWDFTYSYS